MNFLKHFFIGLIGLTFLLAALNALMDPYSIYGTPIIESFNSAKIPGAPRLFKPLQASARQPELVFLGNSRVQVGLDPDQVTGSYNFGIPGMTAKELKSYGLHLLADTRVKHIIIGVDFSVFNDTLSHRGSFLSAHLGRFALLRAIPDTLLSFAALDLSRKTLRRSLKGIDPPHQTNGLYRMRIPKTSSPETMLLNTVKAYISPGGDYVGVRSFKRSLNDLGIFLSAAKASDVRVTLFISPSHAAFMEALDIAKLWSIYEEWKRQLVQIATRYNALLWDFGGYNDLSMTEISNAQRNFIDGSHFRPAIGNRLLDIMMKDALDAGLGTLLTPDNVDSELYRQRRVRDEYRLKRVNDIKRIRQAVMRTTAANNMR